MYVYSFLLCSDCHSLITVADFSTRLPADPPRVHRDLKSGNLLVSDTWVVKVRTRLHQITACKYRKERSKIGIYILTIKEPTSPVPTLFSSSSVSLAS